MQNLKYYTNMAIKKRGKATTPTLKGNGNGKISYKARQSCEKLGKFFEACEEEEEQ